MVESSYQLKDKIISKMTWRELKIASSEQKGWVVEDSSYRGLNYSKCVTEIQGKSILVQGSERFKLARVWVIKTEELSAHVYRLL